MENQNESVEETKLDIRSVLISLALIAIVIALVATNFSLFSQINSINKAQAQLTQAISTDQQNISVIVNYLNAHPIPAISATSTGK